MRFIALATALLATLDAVEPVHSRRFNPLGHPAVSNTTTSRSNLLPTSSTHIAPRRVPTDSVFARGYSNTTTTTLNLFPASIGNIVPRHILSADGFAWNTTTSVLYLLPTPTGHTEPRSHIPTGHVTARNYLNRTTSDTNPSPAPTSHIATTNLDPIDSVGPEYIVPTYLRSRDHTTLNGRLNTVPTANPDKVFGVELGKWNDCIQHHITNDPFHRGQLLAKCAHPPQKPAPANVPELEGQPQVNARAIPFAHHIQPRPTTLVTRGIENPLPTVSPKGTYKYQLRKWRECRVSNKVMWQGDMGMPPNMPDRCGPEPKELGPTGRLV
ncbi:MAG: hypothetical protein Q9213_008268 [Squamulea squamosa]